MSIVTLVSGGLDSTTMALMIRDEGMSQFPLFINYGQLNHDKERKACFANFKKYDLPKPAIADLSGYGGIIESGLTNKSKDIFEDAFLPCRNLIFLTIGAAYAYQKNANAIAIGLLDDSFSIFPDQTRKFLTEAEALLSSTVSKPIRILSPLMDFSKADVLMAARKWELSGTYSCHAGVDPPCGECIACREYLNLEV